jgi:hypothetical protein
MSNKRRVYDAGKAIGKNRASDLKVVTGTSIEGMLSAPYGPPVWTREAEKCGLL